MKKSLNEEIVAALLEDVERGMNLVVEFLDATADVAFNTFLSYLCVMLEYRCSLEDEDVIQVAEFLTANIRKMNGENIWEEQ